MTAPRVAVIGAGVGGLTAAALLAARGCAVTVIERAARSGGKMRTVSVLGRPIDAGPTVLTMRWVLEEIFAAAGADLAARVRLRPLSVLARHAWSPAGSPAGSAAGSAAGEDARARLDLFADVARSADAIAAFAGPAEARGYREFCARAAAAYRALDGAFIRAERPTVAGLVAGAGLAGLGGLIGAAPFATLWKALGEHFRDPRLRQLFGRYATYGGGSPFLASATLMVIAHVEQAGVWQVEGGMHAIAAALEALARAHGAVFRHDTAAAEILVERGRAGGVRIASGEVIAADAVVANCDVAALAAGRLGPAAARAVGPADRAPRSLSAVTWALVAEAAGFPLVHHNVFFGPDSAAEFDQLVRQRRLPAAPTVYVCAADRGDDGDGAPVSSERLFLIVNAPATGDGAGFAEREIESCENATFGLLQRCGLVVKRTPSASLRTTPADFERLFPGTGGALYGAAPHGWNASFRRPGVRTRLPGLFLAGGSVHPGAGVPMAALSGRMAAACLTAETGDLTGRSVSPASFRPTAMPGGTSTR